MPREKKNEQQWSQVDEAFQQQLVFLADKKYFSVSWNLF